MTVWAIWLIAVAVSFAALEAYALYTNKIPTLSRTVWNVSKAWPPFGWLVGIVTGFVASHFWWGGSLICY